PGQPVLTGHRAGVITLNIAEADDTERVRRRMVLHEPYRTLLGHLRHESGHFYWERLVRGGGRIEDFRAMFGDERADYGGALDAHYAAGGAPAGWQDRHVSAYASAHPWEDWAETWAHYLHMVDLLETAASFDTRLTVPGDDEAATESVANPFESGASEFEPLVRQWIPLTLLLNSLNRSLGQEDAYPFALTAGALRKLRFVHDLTRAPLGGNANQAAGG
ncbi:MAG: putative zinc-binding metallopeptidase, partial [Ramlibacter sp.]|nr:putative zinc-binding metallopeptidase [Ramlibacter sp.]